MSISKLFHHRWAAPILAELLTANGSRFVPLAHRLGLSRESLRQTLAALVEAGLVQRNPGYGHPTRPEYVLTARGRRIAPACAALLRALRRARSEELGLKKWSVPVLLALGGERRFTDLRNDLGASPRALALTLKDLADAGLVERRVHDGYPPSTTYRLTPRGRPIQRTAATIAL